MAASNTGASSDRDSFFETRGSETQIRAYSLGGKRNKSSTRNAGGCGDHRKSITNIARGKPKSAAK